MKFADKIERIELGGIFEINVTPLVDVSLVLVCILLLSSPLAFESSITVKKSAISTAVVEERTDNDRIDLRVVSDDSVLVNQTPVARTELRERLVPLLQASTSGLVVVGCDDAVSHGAFVDVLDHAKIAGALEIAVVGR
jgi:biopolymer transport protein ExbD